jgi:hypothetical protein
MNDMRNTTLSHITVCRPIPPDDRRRVWVVGAGHGWECERLMAGDWVIETRVLLDCGSLIAASPREVHDAAPPDLSNVIPIRPSVRPYVVDIR